ncbi:hypothetical protein D3C85_1382590 [compost metagenome]
MTAERLRQAAWFTWSSAWSAAMYSSRLPRWAALTIFWAQAISALRWASVARRAALAAISRSSTRRVASTSRWSMTSMVETISPRRGCWSTSPIDTMRTSASRTGVRPSPVSSASSASTTGLPGAISSLEISVSMRS